ncbi:hypothetical protein DQK91_13165 [Oceanidesulfovibrio marinus]|uniref:Radical SAM core domain-containing protein n=1 Tax=Oceanidesulfovibrio marinus TaxID=370038 RepID=A0A6P1ZER9_9BACT|nr:hypothetical protein DQK91_13165 [Oceanidesulfovibrio marinus]
MRGPTACKVTAQARRRFVVTGIHILLTYACTHECDHCFLYCSPRAKGVMTAAQVRAVLDEAKKIGTVEWIFFEGGEPSLYYPLLLEGVRQARNRGFQVGIVSNAFGAVSDEDAELWLKPLAELGVSSLSLSDDAFHYGEERSPARRALEAAQRLGIPVSTIAIEKPFVEAAPGQGQDKGAPVIGGGAMFKGRAADTLTEDLPRRPYQEFTACTHEELVEPKRLHVDPFGHVHICQGVSMGNMWERPLSDLVAEYEAGAHPICGPLVEGGPALLADRYGVELDDCVDECHCCFLARRALLDSFPEHLAPRQVYGRE